MDAFDGSGVDSVGSVCTCIVIEPCTAIIMVAGAACVPIGTCGVATTITGQLVGSGVAHVASVAICIACAC